MRWWNKSSSASPKSMARKRTLDRRRSRHAAFERQVQTTLQKLRDEGKLAGDHGSSSIVIGKSLGHKTPLATAIYARLHLDPVRKSIEMAAVAMIETATTPRKEDVAGA